MVGTADRCANGKPKVLKMGMDQVKLVGAIINISEHWEMIAESQLQPNLVLPGGELVEIRLPMSLAPSKRLKRRASHHGRASPAPQTATQLLFPSHLKFWRHTFIERRDMRDP